VAVDVLELDGGVVDQDADGERQAAQGHQVHRLTEDGKADERHENRERNRRDDDERAAPAPEKQENHHRGKTRGDRTLLEHADDRRPNEDGLVEQQIHLVFGR